jgi:hypothetical protein
MDGHPGSSTEDKNGGRAGPPPGANSDRWSNVGPFAVRGVILVILLIIAVGGVTGEEELLLSHLIHELLHANPPSSDGGKQQLANLPAAPQPFVNVQNWVYLSCRYRHDKYNAEFRIMPSDLRIPLVGSLFVKTHSA